MTMIIKMPQNHYGDDPMMVMVILMMIKIPQMMAMIIFLIIESDTRLQRHGISPPNKAH